jgi:REP element-mobilizing transposase RayT
MVRVPTHQDYWFVDSMNTTMKEQRKSYIEKAVPYFWTATIRNWYYLLAPEEMKMVVINSLRYLVQNELVKVYGYVIMPNHIHLIWTVLRQNGKESPQGSLLKFTAHQFKKIISFNDPTSLTAYEVEASNKQYEFWQRDSLAIPLFTRDVILQKLNYTHYNPVAKHWRLAVSFDQYRFSSASYYETGIDEFGILSHIEEIF